jgi:hypothetical protein
VGNGLILESIVERAFDEARLVIIPDKEEPNEFMTVLLDEDYASTKVGLTEDYGGLTFGDLHYRKLQFITDARPGKKYLYTHTLLSLFRRKRCNVRGWEGDFQKVASGKAWHTPGKWCRRSLIEALAFEVGDARRLDEVVGDEDGLGDFEGQQTKEEEALMAVVIREGFEKNSSRKREE